MAPWLRRGLYVLGVWFELWPALLLNLIRAVQKALQLGNRVRRQPPGLRELDVREGGGDLGVDHGYELITRPSITSAAYIAPGTEDAASALDSLVSFRR